MFSRFLFIVFLAISSVVNAQQKRINIVHADNSTIDEEKYPGATILLGNVYIEHEGISMRSKKAIHYRKNNILRAFGDVVLNQGDTITQTSRYVQYNGNTKKATSWGNVILKDQLMTLTTDTLYFERSKQLLYYKSGATIKDDENILESKEGNYFLETSKFQALSDVVLTNPEYVLKSNHLDYFTNNGQAFLHGPSTITGKDNFIYTEKGFYDTKNNISHFTKNSRIEYKDRTIKADSLYYDRNTEFASATQHIQIKDTVNNSIIRGNYGEIFQKLDSAFVIGRAVAITEMDKDSMYVHGDTLLVTGKPENRIIRAYHHVKFFKSDLSGKCDSIHTNQKTGLTQLFKDPILWSQDSQITGDTIHLISNPKTEKMDSLKVLRNAFIVQKDSAGYNQIKGRNILGKFIDNDLQDVNVIGNAESIFYVRNDSDNSLIGIDKTTSSSINFKFKDSQIQSSKSITMPDGGTYPLSEFPENVRILRGFIWREDERPLTKDDIFINDDDALPEKTKENPSIINKNTAKKGVRKNNKKSTATQKTNPSNVLGTKPKKALRSIINSKEKPEKKYK
jgi:lipopolysaccharide export system protein LptA